MTTAADATTKAKPPRNYDAYRRAAWTHLDYYPLDQPVDPALYQPYRQLDRSPDPAGTGRSPAGGRRAVRGASRPAGPRGPRWPDRRAALGRRPRRAGASLVGRARCRLQRTGPQERGRGLLVLPERVNGWGSVEPLKSLAGARPVDDVLVRLPEPVTLDGADDGTPALLISREPVQITGRYYALVSFAGRPPTALTASASFTSTAPAARSTALRRSCCCRR